MPYLLVFIGGGLGSLCRFAIAKMLSQQAFNFPLATLLANILSCIILGFFMELALHNRMDSSYKWLIMIGFCGGFSTFSTFSSETFLLLENKMFLLASLNILGSVIICLIAIYVGMTLAKLI